MKNLFIFLFVLLLASCAGNPQRSPEKAPDVPYADSPEVYGAAPPPAAMAESDGDDEQVTRVTHRKGLGRPVLSKGSHVSDVGLPVKAITTDDILSQLHRAILALTVPETRNIKEDVPVKLLLSVNETQQELLNVLNAEAGSYVVSDEVKISKTMSATLTAPDFEVIQITPVRQAISEGETEWLWTLRPKSVGVHHITVTLVAHVMVEGERVEKHIKTFDKTLNITIEKKQEASDFFSKYWQWLFSTLLLPLGLFGWKWFNKRK